MPTYTSSTSEESSSTVNPGIVVSVPEDEKSRPPTVREARALPPRPQMSRSNSIISLMHDARHRISISVENNTFLSRHVQKTKSATPEEQANAFASLRVKPRCIIDPRTSKYVSAWDGVTSLALIFTAIVTPFEVGYLPPATTAENGLFLINRLIDGIFVADLLLQFFLMYSVSEGREGARWVSNPSEIASHYLRGWFGLDFLSIGVSAFDYLSLGQGDVCPGENKGVGNLKVLRTLRALRLVKLVHADCTWLHLIAGAPDAARAAPRQARAAHQSLSDPQTLGGEVCHQLRRS